MFSTIFRSLAIQNYRMFAGGQLVKLLGVCMMAVGQGWLVLELAADSPMALGIVLGAQFLPMALITPYAGALADRIDRRRLLILSNILWSGIALAQTILVISGAIEQWMLIVFAMLLGTVFSIETPVRQSFVYDLVDEDMYPNALALSGLAFQAARIVGPAFAGIAISYAGIEATFLISSLMALVPVVLQTRMEPLQANQRCLPNPGRRNDAKVLDGIRYVRQHHSLYLPMLTMAAIAALGFNFPLTLALLAKTVFHTNAAMFGLFGAALAIGAFAAAAVGTGRRGKPSVYTFLGVALAFGGLTTAVGSSSMQWVTLALLIPTGFSSVYLGQCAKLLIQLGVDSLYRGRVTALFAVAFYGTAPVGSILLSAVATQFGARAAVAFGGLMSLMAAAGALRWQLKHSGERLTFDLRPQPRLGVTKLENNAARPRKVAADR